MAGGGYETNSPAAFATVFTLDFPSLDSGSGTISHVFLYTWESESGVSDECTTLTS